MASTCKLLVEGMHCPSCTRHIEELLAEHDLRNIVVSLYAGTVSFEHGPDFDLKSILTELKDSGYRPILSDSRSAVAGEHPHRSSPPRGGGWFEKLRPSRRHQRRRHKEVCEACRLEAEDDEDHKVNDVVPIADGSPVRWTKSTFGVNGMTCGSCVSSIKSGLHSEGIRSVIVTLIPGRAEITHDQSLISIERLAELIEDLGYEAQFDSSEVLSGPTQTLDTQERWQVRLSVLGMTCAACTGSVKSTIAANMGITNIQVDLMNSLATFTASDESDAEHVKAEIDDIGFEASIADNRRIANEKERGTVTGDAKLRNVRLRVDGMFCGECVGKVNAALDEVAQDHPGFAFSPITLLSPFIAVSYQPDGPAFTARTIRDRIRELGFECVPAPPDTLEQRAAAARARERKLIGLRLLVAFLFAIPTFIIAIVGMSLLPAEHAFRQYWEQPAWGMADRGEIALWALATPVQFGVGYFFYVRSWKSLRGVWRTRRGKVSWQTIWLSRLLRWGSMDTLVALGTTMAYCASIAFLVLDVTASSEMHSGDMGYFDTSIFLIFFILGGRYLEAWSKQYSGDAISELNKTRSTTGLLLPSSEGAPSQKVDAAFIEVGDTLLIPVGSAPPLDGTLSETSASTSFDESALTGESRPVLKKAGDTIYAGTINAGPAAASIRVTSVMGQSMVDGIASAVRDAMSKKAGIERIADTITAFFVPGIVAIACFTLAVWLLRAYTGGLPTEWLDGQRRGSWALFAVEFAIAVLVVACPCGIGLAAPMAQLVGIGLAAKYGILPNGGGEAFQAYSRINAIVLDKTGTLTTSDFKVSDVKLLVGPANDATIWAIAGAVESASSHPLSAGLKTRCDAELRGGMEYRSISLISSEEIAGRGLAATVKVDEASYEVIVGNEALMRDREATYRDESTRGEAAADIRRWQSEAKSVILVAIKPLHGDACFDTTLPINGFRVVALFGLHDPPRPEAFDVVSALTERHIDVYMCTGDNEATARAVARTVGIDPDRVIAHALPDDKRALVQRLQSGSGGKRGVVAFCGDGINDSPALAQADAGIAMGGGSAVALKAAHFTLVGGSAPLLGLVTLVTLSRSTIRKIKANFAYACLYNAALVPLAAGAFYALGRTRLPPVWASLAMALSSVSVVLNSLLMRATYRQPQMVREYVERNVQ